MDEPKSLDILFTKKIFRIPDYQRGYAWQREQLKYFWEDLVNLSDNRSHYTGLLTLKQIPTEEIKETDKEYWLVDDHTYKLYHIVDGQQRLTTFIIFLQAFIDFVKKLPENTDKTNTEIIISGTLTVADVQNIYLFKIPTGDQFRTYKFGYMADNPSYDYLRYMIFDEVGSGSVQKTFYTLNLNNAKHYFSEQFKELHQQEGLPGLQNIYKKLTKRFMFNEYIIKDEFDVFVAFETMNNRGKKLSNLELLKNRLIYLTTLYDDVELDPAGRKSLRDTVNNAWKEVYHQLGRNKARPLNDDDFLRAHWTMYFNHPHKKGWDYIRFLLDEQFTPQKVHKKVERNVPLEVSEEQRTENDFEDLENGNENPIEEMTTVSSAQLQPTEIRDFANSLKESAVYWFNSFSPDLADGMLEDEREWIDRLNRVGMMYFRPLVMGILKNEKDVIDRINIFKQIERFIFISFRMNSVNAKYKSNVFHNAAKELDSGKINVNKIGEMLKNGLSITFDEDGATLQSRDFHNTIFKHFKSGKGYYGWYFTLRYFLYEYELSLLSESIQKKVDWTDLLRTQRDKISIEHIYPQTETEEWARYFENVDGAKRHNYNATLGNLLLLSMSINSKLQNNSFEDKKSVKYDGAGRKIRNGYADGSHSEIEVSQKTTWGPDQIRERGLHLLRFMEKRWDFNFKNDEEREKMLFLNFGDEDK